LLTNGFDLIPDFIRKSDLVRNGFDEHCRRFNIRRIELDVLQTGEAIKKWLLRFDVFHPIPFERVGHFAKNALGRLQSFAGELVDLAFRLELTFASDKDWHRKKNQNVRTEIPNLW